MRTLSFIFIGLWAQSILALEPVQRADLQDITYKKVSLAKISQRDLCGQKEDCYGVVLHGVSGIGDYNQRLYVGNILLAAPGKSTVGKAVWMLKVLEAVQQKGDARLYSKNTNDNYFASITHLFYNLSETHPDFYQVLDPSLNSKPVVRSAQAFVRFINGDEEIVEMMGGVF